MVTTLIVRRYLLVLSCLTAALLTMHLVLNSYNYQVSEVPWLLLQLFELDEENNLPTWFSSFLLLNNAVVLGLSAVAANRQKFYWVVLAAGFLLLSVDEVAGLHETFHTAIDSNWTIYAAILVGITGIVFLPFLLSLPRGTAVLFSLSGLIYISGALVVEFLARDMDEETLAYSLAVFIEEGFEMVGALLFLAVNLNRLKSNCPEVTLRFN